jgi:hypothetical protein
MPDVGGQGRKAEGGKQKAESKRQKAGKRKASSSPVFIALAAFRFPPSAFCFTGI